MRICYFIRTIHEYRV